MEPALAKDARILVIEDEYLLALDLKVTLERLGFCVLGLVSSLPQAHRTLDGGDLPDAAILDVNLHGQSVEPVARRLRSNDIPCLIVSSYEPDEITGPSLSDLTQLQIPVEPDELDRVLRALLHRRQGPEVRA